MDNEKTIAEINELIGEIEKALEPKCEIGAREKVTLKNLLRANKDKKKVKFFSCQRENSAKILTYFVKEKGIPQNRFSMNTQPHIFILY